ncbi:transcriptional regulator NrdR [Patescibacteria group bacterium]
MHCPSCHADDTRVIDSRVIEEGSAIRRRRECEKCFFRFSTLEEMEILSLMVEKADGTEEAYDQGKLRDGLKIALRKRPVTPAQLKRTLHQIEQEIQSKAKRERISSEDVGEIVMKRLKRLDKVAYIRFASVYKSFEDLDAFAEELSKLKRKKSGRRKKRATTATKTKSSKKK